jgi:hypothetical protein
MINSIKQLYKYSNKIEFIDKIFEKLENWNKFKLVINYKFIYLNFYFVNNGFVNKIK